MIRNTELKQSVLEFRVSSCGKINISVSSLLLPLHCGWLSFAHYLLLIRGGVRRHIGGGGGILRGGESLRGGGRTVGVSTAVTVISWPSIWPERHKHESWSTLSTWLRTWLWNDLFSTSYLHPCASEPSLPLRRSRTPHRRTPWTDEGACGSWAFQSSWSCHMWRKSPGCAPLKDTENLWDTCCFYCE